MKKAIIISLLVCVLALGSVGAAFATGMGFSNVGALSLGVEPVPQINTDYIGFHLVSSATAPVTVDGVYISLDKNLTGTNAVSVSLRYSDGTEAAWYAANDVTWLKGNTYLVTLTASTAAGLPGPEQVYYVKVTAAQNSHYN